MRGGLLRSRLAVPPTAARGSPERGTMATLPQAMPHRLAFPVVRCAWLNMLHDAQTLPPYL